MADSPERDALYARPLERIVDFRFDEAVARVFPDMLRRSVPGYATLIALTGILAGRYARDDSNVYDLGCSLGASSLAMRHRIRCSNCRIVAVDNSAAMTDRCREWLAQEESPLPVELRTEDIRHTTIESASVVVLNLTLQFLPPEDRLSLLRRIHAGMVGGGVLILTEKVATDGDLFSGLHEDFKRANGYSELEISQKRNALENVLHPETTTDHIERLHAAGFSEVRTWYQCLNFVSMLAFR